MKSALKRLDGRPASENAAYSTNVRFEEAASQRVETRLTAAIDATEHSLQELDGRIKTTQANKYSHDHQSYWPSWTRSQMSCVLKSAM